MNNDGVTLNVLDSVVHAVLALPGGSDTMKASIPQFINALGFGTIGLDPFLAVAHAGDSVTDCPVRQGLFIQFIKNPNGSFLLTHQPTEQGRGIVGITEVKAEGAFHIRLLGNSQIIKGFFPPIIENQAIHNAPTPKASHLVTAGVVFLHGVEHLQIRRVQPFITQVIGGCGVNLPIRADPAIMELVCGVPLGILAGDLPEEAFPDPMLFVPRVECQRDLLEQAGFFRDSTTDGFIQHIKISFIHDFVCFFNPAPAQKPYFNRN